MWDEHDLSPVLTVLSGPMQGVSFRLGPGRRVIGRDDGADITIDDRKISRRHATVEVASGRALLADAGSTNGTWVNDQRVANNRELHDGDRIRMGQVRLRYFDPSGAATDPVGALRYVSSRQELVMAAPSAGAATSAAGERAASAGAGGALAAAGGGTALAAAGESAYGRTALAAAGAAPMSLNQVMPGAGRSSRMLLTIGGCLAMAGWLTWAYLIW